MTYDEYNKFCQALPAVSHVVQWGGAHVWKVGGKVRGKVFAIGGWGDEGKPAFTFKVSELSFEILRDQPGLKPASYLASRGMKWIQHYNNSSMSDAELKDYIEDSHRIVSLGLTKKLQKELGLNQA